MTDMRSILDEAAVIPVIELPRLADAAPLARALAAGGIRVVELTLRTPDALAAIREMKEARADLIVGMGTIQRADDAHAAVDAGADFLVSPGATPTLLNAFADVRAPALPGVATAGEAMVAGEAGFQAMKFFPAHAAGGVAYLKALQGPLPDSVFCPTGGVSADDAPEYLALANVACVGGSWVAPKEMITSGAWTQIQANAQHAARLSRNPM